MPKNSDFIVEPYHHGLSAEWEEFIRTSSNGTIFHSHRFFAYHPENRFKNHHLIFRMRNKIRAVFTAAEIDSEHGRELKSHPGASYGGFVMKNNSDFEDYIGVVKALIQYAGDNGFDAVSLTQTPLIYHTEYNQGIDFALENCGFTVSCSEMTQSVDLTRLSDNPLEDLVDKTRNACRKALNKGLLYVENAGLTPENLADFHSILFENRKTLGVKPTHTLDELVELSRLIPENLHLAFIEYHSKRIAGLLHFVCNPQVVLLFYVCHERAEQNLKPVPLIMANTLKWAKSRGFRELDFGISTVKGDPNFGLIKFKENFRTRPFLRNTYFLKLN